MQVGLITHVLRRDGDGADTRLSTPPASRAPTVRDRCRFRWPQLPHRFTGV